MRNNTVDEEMWSGSKHQPVLLQKRLPRRSFGTARFLAVWQGLRKRKRSFKTTGGQFVQLFKNATSLIPPFACNSSGTEKLEPFFIGHLKQPRAFKNLSPDQLGLQYSANKKAWMTSSLFSSWLASLDCYVGQTPGRHILLILDSCSAHKRPVKPDSQHSSRAANLWCSRTSQSTSITQTQLQEFNLWMKVSLLPSRSSTEQGSMLQLSWKQNLAAQTSTGWTSWKPWRLARKYGRNLTPSSSGIVGIVGGT